MTADNVKPDSEAILRGASVGWLRLAALGVSFVVAGHFSGWNFGLAYGGWGGMALATALAAIVYLALTLTLGTMVALAPGAGGGATIVAMSLGKGWGAFASAAILLEYVAAAAVVGIFVRVYVAALTGVDTYLVILLAVALFSALHAIGVGEALGLLLLMTVLTVMTLVAFWLAAAPHFSFSNLAGGTAAINGLWLPAGWTGVAAAYPFATAFFLAVEGVPMAAEEAKEPQSIVIRAMMAALFVLGLSAAFTLTLAVGGTSAALLANASDPLMVALTAWRVQDLPISRIINIGALVGLLACLFSAIYAASRQCFAMARTISARHILARVSDRGVPINAVITVAAIAAALAATRQAEGIFIVMVCSAALSYLVMLFGFIKLENLARSSGASGVGRLGKALACVAATGSTALLASTFLTNALWSLGTIAVVAIFAFVTAAHGKSKLP